MIVAIVPFFIRLVLLGFTLLTFLFCGFIGINIFFLQSILSLLHLLKYFYVLQYPEGKKKT